MATIEELRKKAEQVRDATMVGENTAERVGGILVEIVDALEQGGSSGDSGGSSGDSGGGSGSESGCDCTDKLSKSDIVQSTGQSTEKVMSQKAVTDQLGAMLDFMNLNSFSLQMYSANGWFFSHSTVTKTDSEGNYLSFTTLSVKAFYYNQEVTDRIFSVKWTRETSYSRDDEVWNLKHEKIANNIPITYEDLGGDNYEIGDVAFKCEAQFTVNGISYQSVNKFYL